MSDDDLYDLRITFNVKLKKWRVDDQRNRENQEWCLKVYDRNLGMWISTASNGLDRPGEACFIESIDVVERE